MARLKKHIAAMKQAVEDQNLQDFMWALCGTYVHEKMRGEEETITGKDLYNYSTIIAKLQNNLNKMNEEEDSEEDQSMKDMIAKAQRYKIEKKL